MLQLTPVKERGEVKDMQIRYFLTVLIHKNNVKYGKLTHNVNFHSNHKTEKTLINKIKKFS